MSTLTDDQHRELASRLNNAAWTLLETPVLDTAQQAELIALGAAAHHHWHAVGTEANKAHADLLLGWAMARGGVGGPAFHLTERARTFFEETSAAVWERAFAEAAASAACHSLGDQAGHAHHARRAAALGSELVGADANYFRAAFATVPPV